jgi:hypothetical protein
MCNIAALPYNTAHEADLQNSALFKLALYYSAFMYNVHWLHAKNSTCFRARFCMTLNPVLYHRGKEE